MVLLFWGERVFFSDFVVWLAILSTTFSIPLAVYWTLPNMATPLELMLSALDWVMAAILLNGIIVPWLRTCVRLRSGRHSLYVLRIVTALLPGVATIGLCVTLIPRPALVLMVIVYLGLAIHVSCWAAEFWLHMQKGGIAAFLPRGLHEALFSKPPLELLDGIDFSSFSDSAQLATLLLLPPNERPAALALLPGTLRARLVQRGLHNEIPGEIMQLLRPWAEGPNYLRVRPLQMGFDKPTPDKGADVPTVPSPRRAALGAQQPPGWLLLYVLRRHAERTVRTHLNPAHVRVGGLAVGAVVLLKLMRARGGGWLWLGPLASMLTPQRSTSNSTQRKRAILIALLLLAVNRLRQRQWR